MFGTVWQKDASGKDCTKCACDSQTQITVDIIRLEKNISGMTRKLPSCYCGKDCGIPGTDFPC